MILITGANGFIGSALAAELNKRGRTDLILTDYISLKERPQLLANVEYKSFLNPDDLIANPSLFSDISSALHMGACSSTTETNWDYLKKVNLDYSKNLYTICSKKNINFLYASSAAVYGDGKKSFDDQLSTDRYEPLNLYGKSKALFDIWMEANATESSKWSGFRFFNVFGPNEYFKESMASLAYKGFHQIQKTGKLTLFRSHHPDYGDGKQLRDFVYVKDIVQWLLEIETRSDFANGIYNMGSGHARSWLDLANALFSELNKDLNIQWIDIPTSIRDQYQYFTEAKMDKLTSQKLMSVNRELESTVNDYVQKHLIQNDKTY